MSEKFLILIPCNPYSAYEDMSSFVAKLQNAGFLGDSFILYEVAYFHPGEKFFDYITFVNSHPINLLEETSSGLEVRKTVDSKFHCQIRFCEPSSVPQVITSILAAENPPCCPSCEYVIDNWPAVISEWYENLHHFFWPCHNCQSQWQIFELNWKRATGFARYAIEIGSIYPEEAYPNEKLIDLLKRETSEDWTYLYYWL